MFKSMDYSFQYGQKLAEIVLVEVFLKGMTGKQDA